MPEREQVARYLAQIDDGLPHHPEQMQAYYLACADQLIAWFETERVTVIDGISAAQSVIAHDVIERHELVTRLLETIEWLQTIQHRTQHQGMQDLGHTEATCEAKSCAHARRVLAEVRTQVAS